MPRTFLRTVGRFAVSTLVLCSACAFGFSQDSAAASAIKHDPWNPALIGIRSEHTYEDIRGARETLYVFEPVRSVHRPAPLVVYIHGGFLLHGDAVIGYDPLSYNPHDRMISSVEAGLVAHGFVFATINYRLAPRYRWPVQLEDAKAAIRYLRAHAQQFGINPRRVGVMGDSAGGGLSNFVGLTGRLRGYNDGAWAHWSSAVQAVVDMFGPTDRAPFARRWLRAHPDEPNPVFGLYTPRTIARESAVTYVRPGDPPFLIIQGLDDKTEPPFQSIDLYDHLRSVGDRVHLILVRHMAHEFHAVGAPISPGIPALAHDVVAFFERTLR
ncbi:MAG: alpha/beta hydrolase [Firmicutes bacterium]|nr:alpha/beta hydrolase [Bacillota bacterium]